MASTVLFDFERFGLISDVSVRFRNITSDSGRLHPSRTIPSNFRQSRPIFSVSSKEVVPFVFEGIRPPVYERLYFVQF